MRVNPPSHEMLWANLAAHSLMALCQLMAIGCVLIISLVSMPFWLGLTIVLTAGGVFAFHAVLGPTWRTLTSIAEILLLEDTMGTTNQKQ